MPVGAFPGIAPAGVGPIGAAGILGTATMYVSHFFPLPLIAFSACLPGGGGGSEKQLDILGATL